MKHTFSRRKFLDLGARSLGAATLGSSLAPAVMAQAAAPAVITSTDLGYAKLLQGAGGNGHDVF